MEDHQFEIYSANQWMDNVQISVAKALNIPEGSIEVRVKNLYSNKRCDFLNTVKIL